MIPKALCYTCLHTKAQREGKGVVANELYTGECSACGKRTLLYTTGTIAQAHSSPLTADVFVPRRSVQKSRSFAYSFGWSIVLMAVGLALAVLLLTKCAAGEEQGTSGKGQGESATSPRTQNQEPISSLERWTQKAIRRLPVFYEDNPPGGVAGRTDAKEAQLTAIAHAIAQAASCKGQGESEAGGSAKPCRLPLAPRQWAALLLTVGFHESTFSLRIHAGQCRPHECDRGRARGIFQGHQNYANREVWPRMHGLENTAVQVAEADRLLRRSVGTCTPPGQNPSRFVKGIFEAYGGRRCGGDWSGAESRYATFRRLNP